MSPSFHFRYLLLLLLAGMGTSKPSSAQTFKDVAPVLYANCAPCHHSGGLQFPLTRYSEVQPMGALIKTAIQSGNMPPWPADPTYRHYVHERVVSAADKALLINWIDGGMVAGDTTLAPPVPIYGQSQLNGTPDLVLNLPKYTSTATTVDKYICVNVPVNLTQDRYIRAFEFIPGNAAIIHHAVITIDTTGTAVDDYSGNCNNFQGQINIGDYAPGMGPTVLPGVAPTKFGFRLKAGSKMSFQIHLPQGTNGQQDSSVLRVFLYPAGEPGIRDMYFQTVLQNWSFYIPANDSVYVTQKYPAGSAGIPVDISLYGAFPHSHKTCTRIINYAYKNTDTIPLVRIPHWDFHWQGQYTFKNLVKFPQGYHLLAGHFFDNTTNNPETPNHNVAVMPGLTTDDEMLFDSYLFAYYQAGDELVDIEALLLSDPLFYPTGISETVQGLQGIMAYPNPFHDRVNIDYTLERAQFVRLAVFNLWGQEVSKLSASIEGPGRHTHSWDGRTETGMALPKGVYLYSLQAGQCRKSGTLILE